MKFKVPQKTLSLQRLFKSFTYAINGLKILIKEEQNYLIHLTAATAVIVAGFVCKIQALEWIVLILSIQIVLSLETINTTIENLADFITTERSPAIMRIKDLAAAGVLIAAITAATIGLIIFMPKFFNS